MTILNEAYFKQNWSCSECKQRERKWKQLCRNELKKKKSLNPKKSGQHKQLQLDTHLILSESSPLRCGLLVTRMRNVPSGQASSCFWAVRRSMSPTYLVDRDNSLITYLVDRDNSLITYLVDTHRDNSHITYLVDNPTFYYDVHV